MRQSAEQILKVTNPERFHIGAGGESFPGGTEGKIVRVKGFRSREIVHNVYLKVEVLDKEIGAAASSSKGDSEDGEGNGPNAPTPDSTGGEGAAAGQSNEVSPAVVGETKEGEVQATEAAIKLASQLGVDLAEVEATGSKGQVTKSDVEAYAEEETG